jgi:hypothetical protein
MRAHRRVRVPFWPIRFVLEPDLDRRGRRRAVPLSPGRRSFIKCLLRGLVSLRMARPHRQAREPELAEKPADLSLGELDIEPCLDLGLKIDAAPAHHAVHSDIRTLLDQPRQLGQLFSVQPRPPPRPRPVAQPLHPTSL